MDLYFFMEDKKFLMLLKKEHFKKGGLTGISDHIARIVSILFLCIEVWYTDQNSKH